MAKNPFCGSGTTAVAAKSLNRQFICFEMNQEYCNSGIERLGCAGYGKIPNEKAKMESSLFTQNI